MGDAWVGLFSGGKDSSWAVHRALERGLPVERLLTVHPGADSFMYHVPETGLAPLAAESIGLPLVEVDAPNAAGDGGGGEAPTDGTAAEKPDGPHGADTRPDATARGDAELEPLADGLAELDAEHGLGGVTVGAVASTYQGDRIERVCDELGCDLFAPLWGAEPIAALDRMLDAGFEIRILAVAAAGFDASWLGRTLDRDAVADLRDLRDRYGVHPMGEGGEFETLVTDGPHMDRPLRLEYETEWAGDRGRIRVTDARLGD
jgi:diphthine-ammonia ligase